MQNEIDTDAIVPIAGSYPQNSTIKVHVDFIKKFFKLSAFELDFIFFVATNINKIDEVNKIITFNLIDVSKVLGLNSKNCYAYIKQVTDRIKDKPISININENNKEVGFEYIPWFAYLICIKGKITIEFSTRMLKFFKNINKHFALIYYSEFRKLTGTYAKRFYLECRAFLFKGKIVYSIEELRQKFLLEPNEYKQYGDFKKKIIIPAYKQLKEKSSVCFEYKEIKEGRKVVAIVFYIKKNKVSDDALIVESADGKLCGVNIDLINTLIDYGIQKEDAKRYVKNLKQEDIELTIEYCLKFEKTNKVENFGGFLKTGLDKAYNGEPYFDKVKELKKKEKIQKKEETEKKKERLANIYSEFSNAYQKYQKKIFNSKTKGEHLAVLKDEFLANRPPYLQNTQINDADFENKKMIKDQFVIFVIKKYGLMFDGWLKENYNGTVKIWDGIKYIVDIETEKDIEFIN